MLKKSILNVIFSSLFVTIFAFVTYNEASASALSDLSDAQKAELYAQYQLVIEEVIEEYNLQPGELGVAPIDTFTDEAWVEPEVYRERAIQMSQLKQTSVEEVPSKKSPIQTMNTLSNTVTQNVTFSHGSGVSLSVSFSANFYTTYNTTQGRMVFYDLASLNATPNNGKWTSIQNHIVITEGGRTLRIEGSGITNYLGVSFTQTFTLYYTCQSTGTIIKGV